MSKSLSAQATKVLFQNLFITPQGLDDGQLDRLRSTFASPMKGSDWLNFKVDELVILRGSLNTGVLVSRLASH